MSLFLTVLHVMVCAVLVMVVLLQQGKGADIGAVFGGGASNTVFGSRGAGNFLTRLTTGAAILFMVTSLSLSYIANQQSSGVFDEAEAPAAAPGAFDPPLAEEPGATGPAGGFEEMAPPTAEVEAPAEPAAEVPSEPVAEAPAQEETASP